MKRSFIIKTGIAVLLLCCVCAKVNAQADDEQAIRNLMRLEEQYWSAGNIEAYVGLYAPHDSTRMIYDRGAVYGKDSILAFYKKNWPKERMGKLVLDGERLERLSAEFYFVSGYFHVSYPDGHSINGRFSGLMRKMNGRWYIYTDHSG